jgi:hypothetical protein
MDIFCIPNIHQVYGQCLIASLENTNSSVYASGICADLDNHALIRLGLKSRAKTILCIQISPKMFPVNLSISFLSMLQ